MPFSCIVVQFTACRCTSAVCICVEEKHVGCTKVPSMELLLREIGRTFSPFALKPHIVLRTRPRKTFVVEPCNCVSSYLFHAETAGK